MLSSLIMPQSIAQIRFRAVQDKHYDPRLAAFRALAEHWPDEKTRKLLEERTRADGFAASEKGRKHSEFGRIVFTRDVDGLVPYLDPAKALSRKHIEKATKEANGPDDEVAEMVRSLSEHMGWDITKGAAESLS